MSLPRLCCQGFPSIVAIVWDDGAAALCPALGNQRHSLEPLRHAGWRWSLWFSSGPGALVLLVSV